MWKKRKKMIEWNKYVQNQYKKKKKTFFGTPRKYQSKKYLQKRLAQGKGRLRSILRNTTNKDRLIEIFKDYTEFSKMKPVSSNTLEILMRGR